MSIRLAIVLSHPVQYYSPWFRHLAARPELCVKVFYLWDFGVKEARDRTFGTTFKWDIPLLDGYDSEFIRNRSTDPGTHHFRGLDNPGAPQAVADWKPDAVLLFGYAYLTQLRLIFSRRLVKIPFYFRGDSHELCPVAGWKSKISRGVRSLLFRRFAGFFAVGEANARYFRACGVAGSKIHRVPHCVDNARFQVTAAQAEIDAIEWKRKLGIPARAPVVLFAGKFEDKKRPLDLLDAFSVVMAVAGGTESPCSADSSLAARGVVESFKREKQSAGDLGGAPLHSQPHTSRPIPHAGPPPPDPVLLFVGSGHLEAELRKRAGAALGRSVFFAPFQNQTVMPMVYASGDLLVLPSHGRGETWGLAVNEAMNMGRPAIVSSHVGCGPDLILPAKTGWIFKAGDQDELKSVLAEALSDAVRLKAMGQQARDHIANYSYERATESLIAVIKEIR